MKVVLGGFGPSGLWCPQHRLRPAAELRSAPPHSLGVKPAIDDFGTGNSSLPALSCLPFQILKVDQSFVSGIGVRPGDETIVAATIGLAHWLGLTVVAEGVETEAQREFLTAHGCDELRGYLLGRPEPRLPASATEGWAPA
ncbi:MAG: EAL domain-containing protein [Candidatus Dormibacteria bacterium]